MSIQEMIDRLCEGEMYKRVATGQNMSLGQLINALREVEGNMTKTKEVRLENDSALRMLVHIEATTPIWLLNLLEKVKRNNGARLVGNSQPSSKSDVHWI
jgi:hypothetical protein